MQNPVHVMNVKVTKQNNFIKINDYMDKFNLIEKSTDALFFSPGDVVILKQDLINKPRMIVKTIDKTSDPNDKPKLVGVTCMWFNTLMELQTARFSTKDLQHGDTGN